jgi:hypothetical protein
MQNELQKKLDLIIEDHKAQPVGSGYIDLIVHTDLLKSFISNLFDFNYRIIAVSWWEYSPNIDFTITKTGGPIAKFYPGRYSEMYELFEDFDKTNRLDVKTTEDYTNLLKTELEPFIARSSYLAKRISYFQVSG